MDDLAGVCLEVTGCKFLTKKIDLLKHFKCLKCLMHDVKYLKLSAASFWSISIHSAVFASLPWPVHILLAKSVLLFATCVVNQKPYLNSDKVKPKLSTNTVKNLSWFYLKLSYHSMRHVWGEIAMGRGKVCLRKWGKFEQGFWLRQVVRGKFRLFSGECCCVPWYIYCPILYWRVVMMSRHFL